MLRNRLLPGESVAPPAAAINIPSDVQVSLTTPHAIERVIAGVITVRLLGLASAAVPWRSRRSRRARRWPGLWMGSDGRLSTSKALALGWTAVVAHCKVLPVPGSKFRACMYLPDHRAGRDMEVIIHESGKMIGLEYGSPEGSAEFVTWILNRFPPPTTSPSNSSSGTAIPETAGGRAGYPIP